LFEFFESPTAFDLLNMSLEKMNVNSISISDVNDVISSVGCYLIDFILVTFNSKSLISIGELETVAGETKTTAIQLLLDQFLIKFVSFIQSFLKNMYFNGLDLPDNASTSSSISFMSMMNIQRDKYSMLYHLLIFLGHLSGSEKGEYILVSLKMFDLLQRLIKSCRHRDDLNVSKLILSTCNYYTSKSARILLIEALEFVDVNRLLDVNMSKQSIEEKLEINTELKIYVLKLIFNIFRANPIRFGIFFVDIILNSLLRYVINNNHCSTTTTTTVQTNEEIIFELSLNLIEYFLNFRPDFFKSLTIVQGERNSFEIIESLKHQCQISFCQSHKKESQASGLSQKNKFRLLLLLNKLLNVDDILATASNEQMERLQDEWFNFKMDTKYYQIVERQLFNVNGINNNFSDEIDLTSQSFETSPDQSTTIRIYRRINDVSKNESLNVSLKGQVYLPFHINSAIVKYKLFNYKKSLSNYTASNMQSGQSKFTNFIKKFEEKIVKDMETIKKNAFKFASHSGHIISRKEVREVKASLWSIGWLCNTSQGFKWLSQINKQYQQNSNIFQFISLLIKITEDHQILSVRATCFHCLNLLSKTCDGANLIGMFGWHTFQPDHALQTERNLFEHLSLSIGSESICEQSIDIAVILFNINRLKCDVELKEIVRYNDDLNISQFDRDLINKQLGKDLANCSDSDLLINSDNLDVILKNETPHCDSVSVPLRASSLTIKSNKTFNKGELNNLFSFDKSLFYSINFLKGEEERYSNSSLKCLSCHLEDSQDGCPCSFDNNNDTFKNIEDYKILKEIIDQTNQISLVHLEQKHSALVKLKKLYSHKFDLKLHHYISNNSLSYLIYKFRIRKFVQELFEEMSCDDIRMHALIFLQKEINTIKTI
jgi:hypothetical protein